MQQTCKGWPTHATPLNLSMRWRGSFWRYLSIATLLHVRAGKGAGFQSFPKKKLRRVLLCKEVVPEDEHTKLGKIVDKDGGCSDYSCRATPS